MIYRYRALTLLACLALTPISGGLALGGDADVVIEEDFEGGLPGDVGVVSQSNGRIEIVDDGSGGNQVLSLTQAEGNQGAWVWFPQEFDLGEQRVEIEFDLFLGRGTSAVPADGAAVIFQFDNDLQAFGNIGGDLGVGNLRGAGGSYEYIALGFDIWDNGASDRETHCDGRHGEQATCDVEVIQNQASPHLATPPAVGDPPDFISSAAVYGSPDVNTHTGQETFDPDDLIHVSIIFDAGVMRVRMRGGWTDLPQRGGEFFEEDIVLDYVTQDFPERQSNIGFAATTGGANAWQWIDNLVVREGSTRVLRQSEPPLAEGGINCASRRVNATNEIGFSFLADRPFGAEISREGDVEDDLIVTTSSFGRISRGADNTSVNLRPIDLSNLEGAAINTSRLFINDAWSAAGVEYRAHVVPGRYDVHLFWSESSHEAANSLGQGTKLYSVYLNDEKVLCNWSAAAAAGIGSGDPRTACAAALDKAVARAFELDVNALEEEEYGILRIYVEDLGNNAGLNALAFRRTGDATGANAGGELECIEKDPGEEPPGTLFEDNFDDLLDDECPPGMVCNSNNFTPRVLGGRLRITDDTVGSTAATAIYEETVNVCDYKLVAEFDLFLENPDGTEAADGAAFFLREGSDTTALGPGGGGLGLPVGGAGFAVEFDTWSNGTCCNEPSGFNTPDRFTHIGIQSSGIISEVNHVQYNPDLRPIEFGGTGWPNFFDPTGVNVQIEYDAGHITVTLAGITAEGDDFGPEVVCEADLVPVFGSVATIGFAGGTGGRTHHTDIDNVFIDAAEGDPGADNAVTEAIDRARELWRDSRGELYINCGGPLLACSATQNPAPEMVGAKITGDRVVWLGDEAARGSLLPAENEFFTVSPLPNSDGSNTGLQVAATNMGFWNARGTTPGVNDDDRIFHTERWADQEYHIPVDNGEYEVTLYFANSFSGTSGTGARFFHVIIEGAQRDGFEHCDLSSDLGFQGRPNPVFGFDNLYDPVGHAEMLYSSDPCNFAECDDNGIIVEDDPDLDRILAARECGNAAAAALRYTLAIDDGDLTIALTEPDPAAGEPASPDPSPKISGISVRRTDAAPPPPEVCGNGIDDDEDGAADCDDTDCAGEADCQAPARPTFVRGDANSDGAINLTDGVVPLLFLFSGGAAPTCADAADTNDTGNVEITDAIIIFSWLFTGGASPAAPSPLSPGYSAEECAEDPTEDGLGCELPSPVCQ